MSTWLADFESIGDDGEFGFVQQKLGRDGNSLLRCAVLDDVQSTSVAIRDGFAGVFAFDNLRPAGATMVRDITAGIAFASALRSELRDGMWQFVASETERRRIHAEEMQAFLQLRQAFVGGLIGGQRIYVAKRNDGLTRTDAEELLAAIAAHGSGRLLMVTTADAGHAAGTVEPVHGRLAHGRVERFAPPGQPDDVALASWETMLRAAAALFAEAPRRGGHRVRRLAPQEPGAATPAPPPPLPHTTVGAAGGWTAYTPAVPADLGLRRALAGGFAEAFPDEVHFATAYPEVTDKVPREHETEAYFSPPMLELGAKLQDGTERRYLFASMVREQIQILRHIFTPSFYAELLGCPADDPEMLWEHYAAHGLPAGVPPTPLFNPVHYRREAAARRLAGPHLGEPLALHWVRTGAHWRVVPNRVFDEAFYLATYPEIAATGMFGCWHYLSVGLSEARSPTVWFDPDWYSDQEDGTDEDRYDDFIAKAVHEGRMPSPQAAHVMRKLAPGVALTAGIYTALVEASLAWGGRVAPGAIFMLTNLFVPEWHERAATPLDAFIAYLRTGLPAGKRPGPLFDEAVYRQRAEAAGLPPIAAGESAVEHWLRHGQELRIVPTERFDEAGYLARNPDVQRAGVWGFSHFVNSGLEEGREGGTGPMFQLRDPVPTGTGTVLPNAYRQWHTMDFPDDTSGAGGEIPAAAHRRLREFLHSDALAHIFAEAQAIDPSVGEIATIDDFLLSPFHDGMALRHAEIERRMPAAHYDSVVCVPWIRNGGADLVAALLAKALLRVRPDEKVLILRTDHPYFDRADWLPDGADVVDISDQTAAVPPDYAEELLRAVLRGTTARRVFNVNSRLCWNTLRDHGRNIAATLRSYAYLFCSDQTPTGAKYGYPAEFFAETAGTVTAFLTDTNFLRDELTATYRLPAQVRDRIVPMFSPAQTPPRTPSIARIVERRSSPSSRKLVLWAGRLDRQKRFGLVQHIARLMPDVTFRCWGAALLDAPPDLADLPDNVRMEGGFESFDDLPLADAGAWLFTSLWEGMPTTIVELGARGVPIVASAVGGVPELIRPDTGWPVADTAGAEDYVSALRDALSSPAEATRRAEALQRRVAAIHSDAAYDAALGRLLLAEDAT